LGPQAQLGPERAVPGGPTAVGPEQMGLDRGTLEARTIRKPARPLPIVPVDGQQQQIAALVDRKADLDVVAVRQAVSHQWLSDGRLGRALNGGKDLSRRLLVKRRGQNSLLASPFLARATGRHAVEHVGRHEHNAAGLDQIGQSGAFAGRAVFVNRPVSAEDDHAFATTSEPFEHVGLLLANGQGERDEDHFVVVEFLRTDAFKVVEGRRNAGAEKEVDELLLDDRGVPRIGDAAGVEGRVGFSGLDVQPPEVAARPGEEHSHTGLGRDAVEPGVDLAVLGPEPGATKAPSRPRQRFRHTGNRLQDAWSFS